MKELWWLYLLQCGNGKTYIGTASDVEARFHKHRSGKGARFTRINKPVVIMGAEPFPDRSAACQAEYRLKRRPLGDKRLWADAWPWPATK